jgi:hypothetical protein
MESSLRWASILEALFQLQTPLQLSFQETQYVKGAATMGQLPWQADRLQEAHPSETVDLTFARQVATSWSHLDSLHTASLTHTWRCPYITCTFMNC